MGKKFIGNGCEAEGGIQDISQGSDFNNWRIMMPFEIEFGGGVMSFRCLWEIHWTMEH